MNPNIEALLQLIFIWASHLKNAASTIGAAQAAGRDVTAEELQQYMSADSEAKAALDAAIATNPAPAPAAAPADPTPAP